MHAHVTSMHVSLPRDAAQNAIMRFHVVCPSVRQSVLPSVISRPNSLRPMLSLTTTWSIWCNGNTRKNRVEYGWGHEHIKAAKSPTQCNIGPKLPLRTNRKSHMRFRLTPTLMTLDDLERLKRPSCRNKIVLRSSS